LPLKKLRHRFVEIRVSSNNLIALRVVASGLSGKQEKARSLATEIRLTEFEAAWICNQQVLGSNPTAGYLDYQALTLIQAMPTKTCLPSACHF
jgi:hypothetical protein